MTNPISVKALLKNQASASGKTMQEVLILYGLERTIYRMSVSPYNDKFTLKGGIFLYALFDGEFTRATSDIDLLARSMSNSVGYIRKVFERVFSIDCDDALRYNMETLDVKEITEFKEYHGVNVSIMAFLDKTQVPVSVDIGFGDVIYPDRVKMEFPILLDMEVPKIYTYSIVSAISEKFEAIVSLGDANSRYKDFYDIYILATRYELVGTELKEAIRETFDYRGTDLSDIFAFTDMFIASEIHQHRWKAFLNKKKAMINVELGEVIALLKALLLPIVQSINNNTEFKAKWDYKSGEWKNR